MVSQPVSHAVVRTDGSRPGQGRPTVVPWLLAALVVVVGVAALWRGLARGEDTPAVPAVPGGSEFVPVSVGPATAVRGADGTVTVSLQLYNNSRRDDRLTSIGATPGRVLRSSAGSSGDMAAVPGHSSVALEGATAVRVADVPRDAASLQVVLQLATAGPVPVTVPLR